MTALLTPPIMRHGPTSTVEDEVLGPDANGVTMTADEFDAIDDWDENHSYELIRGVVVVSPIASEGETDPNGELEYILRTYRWGHPQGSALDLTLFERYVHLPDGSRRRADRLIWCGLGRLPNPKTDVATIAVEFVSRRRRDWRRDYEEKRVEYRALGIQEYWVIDRFRRQMTVFFLNGTERTVAESETYETPLLPGFQLPLARLLAISDQWSDAE